MSSFVSNAGFANVIASWVLSGPVYLQFGTGSGQTASSNDLAAAAQTRVAGTRSQQTTTISGDTYRVSGLITASSSLTITEVGLFDASSSGNMNVYGDFAGIVLGAGDSIAFNINVKVA